MIAMLAMAAALGPAAMQIVVPGIPSIEETFQVSKTLASLTVSLAMVAIAIGTLFYGPLADKYGRRPIMLLGAGITLVGSLLCAVAESFDWLIAGRVVQAFGGAVGLVLARAIVRDVYAPQDAARTIATVVMVMVVMPMLALPVGGRLIEWFGLHSVFWVTALFCFGLIMLMLWRLPETLAEPVPFKGVGTMLHAFLRLLQSVAFRGYAFCITFASVMFFSFMTESPKIMASVLHRPSPAEYSSYALLMPLGFMAGNLVARQFSRTHTTGTMLHVGAAFAITGVILAIILQLAGVLHPIALFLPVSLAVFGNGITLPNAQAAAINQFPRYAGSASGLTGFLQMSIAALATQLAAIIFNGTALPLLCLLLTAALLSLLCVRMAVTAPR